MVESGTKKINIAYIDAANLDQAMRSLGWRLDYRKFRIWLSDKFEVEHAYIFIGLIPKYRDLYKRIQNAGFTLVFKEVTYKGTGEPKGNCDTDLVVQAMEDAYENKLKEALLISSDGDYVSLVKKLQSREQLLGILSPAPANKCSILLKRRNARMWYIAGQQKGLELRRK